MVKSEERRGERNLTARLKRVQDTGHRTQDARLSRYPRNN